MTSVRGTRRCDHHESLYGRCTKCGMTWAEQARAREQESDRDELRDRLAETLCSPSHRGTSTQASDLGPCAFHQAQADDLLPLIDEDTAAAVAAERERIAAAICQIADWVDGQNDQPSKQIVTTKYLRSRIARIAREEPADA